MAELPRGTVTFLFSDVEGSTRLAYELGERFAELLLEHRRLLREPFERHGGIELEAEGDAFFVVFASAREAVAAAAEAQAALAGSELRVRIGLHTGEAQLVEGTYLGLDVHRAARIAAAGHGGQVLLSQSTRDLIDRELRDLGEHRLKDLLAPEHLYQLGRDEFPPLTSSRRTNLPIPATPFLGRERELAEVTTLLGGDAVRLLTLTGPGGTGKTRLALQAAAEVADRYPDGVFWVGVARLRDPQLVMPTIAQTIGTRRDLAEHIGSKRMLLLLDNLEHLVEMASELAALLAACQGTNLLVTSLGALHLTGEHVYVVPALAEVDAVSLFGERAAAARSDFRANVEVPEICRRLDRLPLAIELAAARVTVLSAAQILERLERRLPLLTGGARDLPERHRTLRATIEWSHELLTPDEQRLFAHLAVFAGGCTLEAAEAICEADIDLLASLVDKSLLRQSDDRFWMLETIREYAAERLDESVEGEELRRRHAEWFTRLAEDAEPEWEGAAQAASYERVEADLDNVRAALSWACEGEATLALRLAGALQFFWAVRGDIGEGLDWLERALACGDGPPAARAKALLAASYVGVRTGATERARELAEEALAIYRRIDDRRGIAHAARDLANALTSTEEYERANALLEESAELSREIGDTWNLSIVLNNLGYLALTLGDNERAKRLCDESLALRRARGDERGIVHSLANVALADLDAGRPHEALAALRELLAISERLGFKEAVAAGFLSVAAIVTAHGDAAGGARLLGAAEELAERSGFDFEVWPYERRLYESTVAEARSQLGHDGFSAALEDGRALSLSDAIALAGDAADVVQRHAEMRPA